MTTLAKATGATQDRQGRVLVDPDLSVPRHPNIWVIGDAASCAGLPGVAEVAMQGGLHVARVIRHRLTNPTDDPATFHYRDLGTAAYISRGHALVRFRRLELSGFLGWLLWGAIHLVFLAGVRNRFTTVATWLFTLGLNRRAERVIIYGDLRTADQPYDD
jgi:NADH dehydrogenase